VFLVISNEKVKENMVTDYKNRDKHSSYLDDMESA